MKDFKWALTALLLVIFFCVLFVSPGIKAEQKEDKNVCFRWAFGAMVGAEDNRKLVAITRDTTLKTGDQFKMLCELQEKCFVYLIYQRTE